MARGWASTLATSGFEGGNGAQEQEGAEVAWWSQRGEGEWGREMNSQLSGASTGPCG